MPELADVLRPIILRLARQLRHELRHLGVTGGQALALALVAKDPGVGVRELARRENVSSPAMTAQIRRLEQAGLVRRGPIEGDARRCGLYATAAGLDVLDRITLARTHWLAERIARLEPGERAAIDDAVDGLAKLLEVDSR